MADPKKYALVVPTNFRQCVFEHTCVGVPDKLINTIGFSTQGGTDAPTAGELSALAVAWAGNIVPLMNVNITFARFTASDAGGVIYEELFSIAGADNAAPASVNNAVLVEKRTGVSGRANRGRMYVPIVDEATVSQAGDLTQAYIDSLQDNFDQFLTDAEAIGANTGELYILHSKSWPDTEPPTPEPADPGNAPAPTRITSLVVKSKIGTQRRRLR